MEPILLPHQAIGWVLHFKPAFMKQFLVLILVLTLVIVLLSMRAIP
jgi:hypothetical protein